MLSVVIATENSERTLVATLAALVPGAAAGLVREVIVADRDSSDATAEVADVAGCQIAVTSAPLGERLQAAAASARATWLLFLRPGTVLDSTWIDEAGRFMHHAELAGREKARAAVFRPTADAGVLRPALTEGLALIAAALGARPHPQQGLLIAKSLYQEIGGHRDGAADSEADFLRRLGRRRIVLLRTRTMLVAH